MSEESTAEQMKEKCITQMGDDLGLLYNALWQQLALLYIKWQEFEELFCTKPSRVDLLNKSAPQFFRIVQDALWGDLILDVARITDSPRSCGKENLTIQALPGLMKDAPEVTETVRKKIAEVIELRDFCKDWRNRRIAHRDLALAIDAEKAVPLKPATRKKMRQALAAIAEVLNIVSHHYLGSTNFFEPCPHSSGALSLLSLLDDGLNERAHCEERIRRGEYRKSDIGPREI